MTFSSEPCVCGHIRKEHRFWAINPDNKYNCCYECKSAESSDHMFKLDNLKYVEAYANV